MIRSYNLKNREKTTSRSTKVLRGRRGVYQTKVPTQRGQYLGPPPEYMPYAYSQLPAPFESRQRSVLSQQYPLPPFETPSFEYPTLEEPAEPKEEPKKEEPKEEPAKEE